MIILFIILCVFLPSFFLHLVIGIHRMVISHDAKLQMFLYLDIDSGWTLYRQAIYYRNCVND